MFISDAAVDLASAPRHRRLLGESPPALVGGAVSTFLARLAPVGGERGAAGGVGAGLPFRRSAAAGARGTTKPPVPPDLAGAAAVEAAAAGGAGEEELELAASDGAPPGAQVPRELDGEAEAAGRDDALAGQAALDGSADGGGQGSSLSNRLASAFRGAAERVQGWAGGQRAGAADGGGSVVAGAADGGGSVLAGAELNGPRLPSQLRHEVEAEEAGGPGFGSGLAAGVLLGLCGVLCLRIFARLRARQRQQSKRGTGKAH